MSLFRDEAPIKGAVILDPTKPALGVASGGVSSGLPNGSIWYGADNKNFNTVAHDLQSGLVTAPAIQSLAAAVANTNATAATNLMTQAFDPSVLSVLNKTIYLFGAGRYTTDSGTARTATVAVTLNDGTNTRTILTWTSAATTASQTNMPWNLDAYISINVAGSAGKVFAHGALNITLGASAAGALTSYNDTNAAASSTIDLTQTVTLAVNQLYSGSNAGNTFTQDTMIIQLFN